jgi:HK97 family phage major capsid protein
MVRARLDSELLNGNGTPPNLTGILNTAGIQTQAKGTDPTPDAILKALDLIRVNSFYEPDAIILHPNDLQAIRLLRSADGIYLFGHPAQPGPGTIWGLPIVASTALTENTGLVGCFKQAAMLFWRRDMEIAVSDSHSDFFIRNQVMLRAEVRVALACFRPSAFCQLTGI